MPRKAYAFDPNATLVAARPAIIAGKDYQAGDPVDMAALSSRRWRQLFDSRVVRLAEEPLLFTDVVARKAITIAGKVYKAGDSIPFDAAPYPKLRKLIENGFLQTNPTVEDAPQEETEAKAEEVAEQEGASQEPVEQAENPGDGETDPDQAANPGDGVEDVMAEDDQILGDVVPTDDLPEGYALIHNGAGWYDVVGPEKQTVVDNHRGKDATIAAALEVIDGANG